MKNTTEIIVNISIPEEDIFINVLSFIDNFTVASFCVKTILSPKSIEDSMVNTLLAANHKPIVLSVKNFR